MTLYCNTSQKEITKENGSEAILTNVQAVYFHLNLTCVRKILPTIEMMSSLITMSKICLEMSTIVCYVILGLN